MAAHTTEQRAFIVHGLATYVSAVEIAETFKARWRDTDCAPEDVAACAREFLSADWQAFFDRQREAFLAAPTADQRVRVAELHRMFVKARDRNAIDLAAKLLGQIAIEAGSATGAPAGAAVRQIEWTIVDPTEQAPEAVASAAEPTQ